jgi:carotenoid cleavage dioxygenase-like enzyme
MNKTTRWVIDPSLPTNTRITPFEELSTLPGEFSRIDDRYVTKSYNHFWQNIIDPSREYDFAICGAPVGGLFNCMGHFTWDKKVNDIYFGGPTQTFQEPTFIPKKNGGEGEGWIICLLNHLDVQRNDIVIFDAQNFAPGPIAIVHLPFSLKLGLHGNWVDQGDIKAWDARRAEGGDLGPVKAAEKPLPWQIQQQEKKTNGVNGTD